jgi:hypothetical protein
VARYHFQVRTESHVALTETADLQGAHEARVEAARRIGVLLHDHAHQLWADEEWRMDVTDERGLILFTIQVSTMDCAATLGSKRTGGLGED